MIVRIGRPRTVQVAASRLRYRVETLSGPCVAIELGPDGPIARRRAPSAFDWSARDARLDEALRVEARSMAAIRMAFDEWAATRAASI